MSYHEPTVEEELHRKSGEALLWLDNMLKRGAIDSHAAQTALTLMDLATLGLIPREYSEWAGETRRALRSEKHPDKVVMTCVDKTVVISLDRSVGNITITSITPLGHKVKVAAFESETDTVAAASAAYPKTIKNLEAMGYKVIA